VTEHGPERRTYVLIHGSWHGGWCWDRLAPILVARAGRVLAPTLVGLGDLASLATPATGLSTHLDQLEAFLAEQDVRDAVLVGHSYAGMLLTGIAERVPQRLASLVYLDALIPADGQSCFDLMPGVEDEFQAGADAVGDGWLVPPLDAADLGVTDPSDASWVNGRLTPMPIMTHRERLAVPRHRARALRRSFVLCRRFGFHAFAAQARADGFDVVTEIDAGHDVQVTHPRELSEILLALP